MVKIKLQSSDDDIIDVDERITEFSNTIKLGLSQCDSSEGSPEPIVRVPNVNTEVLQKVVKWVERHKRNDLYKKNIEDPSKISAWDIKYLDIDTDELYQLIQAADYLGIKYLLEIACKRAADMIKDKSAAELRTAFQVRDDCLSDEEEGIRVLFDHARI